MFSSAVSGCCARRLAQASIRNALASSRDGLNTMASAAKRTERRNRHRRTGLAAELAQVTDRALGAFRPARDARIAAVQDQPMMRILLELVGHEFFEAPLDFIDILAGPQSGTIGDAKNVRVDGNRRMAERRVQHHVRRLA